MGRKKKVVEEEKVTLQGILDGDAKRGILAVFLFAFSAIALLGYFGAAGTLGSWINTGIGVMVGVGKWLLPLLLVTIGIFLLQRRKPGYAEVIKYLGLFLIFFVILALLHLYQGDTPEALWQVAKEGRGGGVLGFLLAGLLLKMAGVVAATILLIALLIAGVIAAFNVSLVGIFNKSMDSLEDQKERLRAMREERATLADEEEGDEDEDDEEYEEDEYEEDEVDEEAEALSAHNIQNLSFGDGEEDSDEDEEGIDEEDETDEDEAEYEESDEENEVVNPKRKRRRRNMWELPKVELLDTQTTEGKSSNTEEAQQIIQDTLGHFGIPVEPVGVRVGPTVTQYTFRPGVGVKVSRITTLSNDLALALAAQSIRIEAPVPGQSVIGIEIPNESKATVRLRSMLEDKAYKQRGDKNLLLALGHDVAGESLLADLRKMPHLLIAGRTGSGKSVCVNALLLSLLYQNSPEDLKLILVDPKRVELSIYKGIPHLKTDVVVDNKKVVNVLKWAVAEMERRYKLLESAKVRDLLSYLAKYRNGDTRIVTDEEGNMKEEPLENLPTIVIVIDEMADLMIAHGKEVEALIIRLAQMSRAIGIHLILATQRPSVEVLTGLIKANIPTRIAFQVTTQVDSRTILDTSGAEKLLGSGDMLYAASEGKEMKRIQGAFISDDEIKRVVMFWKDQKEDLGYDGDDEESFDGEENSITAALDTIDEGSKEDDLYDQAKEVVVSTGRPSTTYLQTALGIGYPRAARLTALLEKNGVIGMVGNKRVVLAKQEADGEDDESDYGDDHIREQQERDTWSA